MFLLLRETNRTVIEAVGSEIDDFRSDMTYSVFLIAPLKSSGNILTQDSFPYPVFWEQFWELSEQVLQN